MRSSRIARRSGSKSEPQRLPVARDTVAAAAPMAGYRTSMVIARHARDSPPGITALEPTGTSADTDVAGLYGPSSEAWRLNREALLLLGAGPRSLLLQIAHPLVAEGVDQHSAFRADPWSRLAATVRSYLRVVYGTAPAARAEIARLNRMHRTIVGPVRDPAAA